MLLQNKKCPICKRMLVDGPTINEHHLIPRTFKGKETITLHKVCHDKLHHTFTEREMVNYYHTIERLCEHDEIQKFIKWVANKDPEFYIKHKDTKRRNRKR